MTPRTIRGKRRHGFTLTELLVVMATSGIVFGLACCLLKAMMKIDRGAREDLTQHRAFEALSSQFHRDVAGATAAQVRPAVGDRPAELELKRPAGEVIVYLLGTESIRREVRSGDKRLSTETYRLGRGTTARSQVDTGGGQTRVRLIVQRKGLKAQETARDFPIDAVLARDYRFAHRVP